jgi:hypothetical protein
MFGLLKVASLIIRGFLHHKNEKLIIKNFVNYSGSFFETVFFKSAK